MVKLARWMAWSLVAALAFVTLAPIGLRPVLAGSANLERAAAYAVLGLLFALAYPRHRMLALVGVVAVAGLLEAGQMVTESRHGRLADFAIKGVAAALGVLAARVLPALNAQRDRGIAPPG